ncbi:MAG: c-type cytochrome domain-containing protein, partial [Bacteroidota bacterium]
LEKAPRAIQQLAGYEEETFTEYPRYYHPDSTLVFEDLISPILEKKCVACHNDNVTRGGLNMTTQELLLSGGDNGEVIIPGNASESELFLRLSLEKDNPKYMPPKGMPLSYPEKRLIEWWLQQQSLFDQPVSQAKPAKDIQSILLALFGLDTKPKPYYEIVNVVPANEDNIRAVEEKGFRVTPLAADNHLLHVSRIPGQDTVSAEAMTDLRMLSGYITWLDLGKSGVANEYLSTLGEFEHLTRLRLENNSIDDQGLVHLENLAHLESLNLYGNAITDAGLSSISKLPSLQRLYLWKTKVTTEGVVQLKEIKPDLMVDLGVEERGNL